MFAKATNNITNFVWFQSIWLLAIIFQDQWLWLIGILLIGFFIASEQRVADGVLMGSVALTGVIIDSLLTLSGVFVFTTDNALAGVIPWWLVALWMAFGGTLRHSLRYLGQRRWLCILAGGVSGPLSYWAGERLGAVEFGYSLAITLPVLSLIWATVLPLSFYLMFKTENTASPLTAARETND